jgi:hypothetical protein
MKRALRYLTVVVCLSAVGILPAAAATIVIPNVNLAQPGPSNQAFPLNQGNMRYQQVYAADQFQGMMGTITAISFRTDESTGLPFVSNPIDVEVRLSHTKAVPTALSLTFDDNVGTDATLVYDGPLSLSSAGLGAFDIVMDIDDVFLYDGVRNLLMEIKVFGPAITTQFDAAGTGLGEGGTVWTDRLWAFDPNAVTGSSDGDDGYVTQFTLGGSTPTHALSWGAIKSRFLPRR